MLNNTFKTNSGLIVHFREALTPAEITAHLDGRYRVLRQPWNEPKGNETDELEPESIKWAAFNNDVLIAGARAHILQNGWVQIRFVFVLPEYRNMGIGEKLILTLHQLLIDKHNQAIKINARVPALNFWLRLGYKVIGDGPTLFGVIEQKEMHKYLAN